MSFSLNQLKWIIFTALSFLFPAYIFLILGDLVQPIALIAFVIVPSLLKLNIEAFVLFFPNILIWVLPVTTGCENTGVVSRDGGSCAIYRHSGNQSEVSPPNPLRFCPGGHSSTPSQPCLFPIITTTNIRIYPIWVINSLGLFVTIKVGNYEFGTWDIVTKIRVILGASILLLVSV
jgi:hypothetical protein